MFAFALAPEWGDWIYRALTFLVISCPCALVISIPLSFFAGIGGASHEGVLVKGSNYLETMAQTKYVVFDKTGTMTQGVFEVNGVHHNTMPEEQLLEYAALAECSSSHPISKSLQKAYGKQINRDRVTEIEELSGKGVTAKVDGIPVAAGNAKLMKYLNVEYSECEEVGTIVHVAVNGKYAGHILISDKLKPHAKEAIRDLKKAGITKTVMLTGDMKRVADKVAEELGIYFDEEINNRLRGVSRMESFEIILERYEGEMSEEEKECWTTKKNDIYKELLKNMSPADLSAEVKETLDDLRANGHKLAIGSSSKNARFILGQLGLGEYFDAISDGNNISKSKPDPEVFVKAAEYVDEQADKCLVVEDAKAGLQAAIAGGMDCAAIGDAVASGLGTYNQSAFADLLKVTAK